MYLPPHFAEVDQEEILHLLDAFPLAVIVSTTSESLVANHLPLMMIKGKLVGHCALANDMHRLIKDGAEVLVIFNGEDSYISPNWYPTKFIDHQQVPTWNYQTVHIIGKIRFANDDKTKRAVVARLTHQHERATNGDAAWKMSDAPKDYVQQMIDQIVAFDIEVCRTIAKTKIGQNKAKVDFDSVAEHCAENGKARLSARMQKEKNSR